MSKSHVSDLILKSNIKNKLNYESFKTLLFKLTRDHLKKVEF